MATQSSKIISVTTIQPPIPGYAEGLTTRRMTDWAVEQARQSAQNGTDMVCLPEFFNVFGLDEESAKQEARQHSAEVINVFKDIAKSHQTHIILPLYYYESGTFRNCAFVIDRAGDIIGRYDKSHPTRREKSAYAIQQGDTYPVFDTDCGKVGIMICYDVYFPEVARILSLEGARIIFFPTLQRRLNELVVEIQMRARAIDSAAYIVRSSFGLPAGVLWKPGIMCGRSSIVDPEGRFIADAGHHAGAVTAQCDIEKPVLFPEPGEEAGSVDMRQYLLEDRRPDTYTKMME